MLDIAYEKLKSPDNKMFVVVAGNIGSGKTTLTQKLSERLGWKPYFESVSDNPYLEDFYKDMDRWSFSLQVYFLNHRFNTHRQIESKNGSAIQDRSIYEDAHIFARALHEQGKMSTRDYKNYLCLYESMTEFLQPPTLMICLKRSIPKLMERIQARGRDCEKSISVDYLSKLNDYYYDWFENYQSGNSLIIDTDELDFLENEHHFNGLVSKICDSIDQKDLFLRY